MWRLLSYCFSSIVDQETGKVVAYKFYDITLCTIVLNVLRCFMKRGDGVCQLPNTTQSLKNI